MRETEPAAARLPLLFLVADTARAMTKLRARTGPSSSSSPTRRAW